MKRVKFEVIRGSLSSWQSLFEEAAKFASRFNPNEVISISHSCDHSEGVVTVWYWQD
jgi:hypothetical protein